MWTCKIIPLVVQSHPKSTFDQQYPIRAQTDPDDQKLLTIQDGRKKQFKDRAFTCPVFFLTFSSPNPAIFMPSCMVKVCVNSGVLVFFLARMLSMLVYLLETISSYQDAISKGFLGISLLPSRHTEPKVGVLSSDSDVERMRGHSSDHPIMPISWLLKIPCCELVDDRSTWLLTKPYHWFRHKG